MAENHEEDKPESYFYFLKMAEDLVAKNGLTFDDYLKRHPELLRLAKIGDQLISNKETTGYNLLADPKDMDLMSSQKLLFYNVYTSDAVAISDLMSNLVERGLIDKKQVLFGVKTSKVRYANWPESPNEIIQNLYPDEITSTENPKISKTLDIVATLSIDSGDNKRARAIYKEIRKLTSWKYPDLRSTISLHADLPKTIFAPVQANILIENNSHLVALRRKTTFEKPWRCKTVIVNKELAGFIATDGVKP